MQIHAGSPRALLRAVAVPNKAANPSRVPFQVLQGSLHQRQARRQARCVTLAGIKAVESFDSSFTLDTASQEVLYKLMHSEVFREQVVQQCSLPEGTTVEFTELLFQPVPWSPTTRRGMPAEFEVYLDDPQYSVINVPPNFMFSAKIFKPSRLCAIFKLVS